MAEWYTAIASKDSPSKRKLVIAAAGGVVLVAIIGSVLSNVSSGAGEVAIDTSSVAPTDAPSAKLVVQVVGQVASPGVVELEPGARVLDAVQLAGGLTERADPASLNLARLVTDGEQIVVGQRGRTAVAGHGPQIALVNINRAAASDFEGLPRIGPTLAERIVAFRDAHGPFASIDALLDVPGIGKLTLDGMRDQLTL
jgi:competence protein ComEA